MSEQNIKSPFMGNAKIIRQQMSSEELAHRLLDGFSVLLKQLSEENIEPNVETFKSYIAGVIATLKNMGFESKDVEMIAKRILDLMREMSGEYCDCPNCRKEK